LIFFATDRRATFFKTAILLFLRFFFFYWLLRLTFELITFTIINFCKIHCFEVIVFLLTKILNFVLVYIFFTYFLIYSNSPGKVLLCFLIKLLTMFHGPKLDFQGSIKPLKLVTENGIVCLKKFHLHLIEICQRKAEKFNILYSHYCKLSSHYVLVFHPVLKIFILCF
jgi:hypothetical protein